MLIEEKDAYDYEWTGLNHHVSQYILENGPNPLENRLEQEIFNPGAREYAVMNDSRYMYFTAKILLDMEIMPFQAVLLDMFWKHSFPMLIGSRGLGKTSIAAIYSIIRAFFYPGSKIVVAGSAFRQSKFIFDYIEAIWDNAPVLRSLCNNKSGPRRAQDMLMFNINESKIYAIPIGTGEKIRGLRGNVVIADEFNCLDPNTLVETDKGLLRIKDSFDRQDFSLVNKDGDNEYPNKYIKTPTKVKALEVKTRNGYTFICSEGHQILTKDGWKKPLELTDNDYLVFDNKYQFPTSDKISKELAWLCGVLIAEGSINDSRQIQVSNTDIDLLHRIGQVLGKEQVPYTIKDYPAYISDKGWKCKSYHVLNISNRKFREKLEQLGLDFSVAINKKIPWSILQSSKEVACAFLAGAWEGDGTGFLFGKNRFAMSYYTISHQLATDIHVLLSKLDILAQKQIRSSKISDKDQWMIRVNGQYALDLAKLLDVSKFNINANKAYIPYISDSGCIYTQNNKIYAKVYYAGQDKFLGRYESKKQALEAISDFKNTAPKVLKVNSVKQVESRILYDYHLPKTHSFYGAGFVQHNSINTQIYEVVIKNFGAVSLNPIKAAKRRARLDRMERMGLPIPKELRDEGFKNQSIIMGTMGFEFEPLFEYWQKYKNIISNKGLLDTGQQMKSWREFSIMRMPYELIPKGFMSEETIEAARATMHTAYYNSEFGCVPVKDTTGFFKRTIIESCVANPTNVKDKMKWPSWCPKTFDARLKGDKNLEYVIGIDPAAEDDNFAIVVLEVHPEHARVVYSWTVNKKQLGAQVKNYYAYCAKKVRELMKAFNVVAIGIDAQGGGTSLAEALQDEDKLEEGQVPLWPIIEEKKSKDTDDYPGKHMLHMIQFASSEWTSKNNHGMLKDLQSKTLLFPDFNAVLLGLSPEEDKSLGIEKSIYSDSYEDCLLEIEELKKELSIINHTKTSTREKWDTPEIIDAENKKSNLKKDRYSALLIANSIAREYNRNVPTYTHEHIGGAVGHTEEVFNQPLYKGVSQEYNGLSPSIFRAIGH